MSSDNVFSRPGTRMENLMGSEQQVRDAKKERSYYARMVEPNTVRFVADMVSSGVGLMARVPNLVATPEFTLVINPEKLPEDHPLINYLKDSRVEISIRKIGEISK